MGMFRKAGGGGFLNGVDGVVTDYKFDGKIWGEGKDAYTSLSVELLVKQDGADEPVQQFLSAGFLYEGDTVSEDGHTLETGDGNARILDDSEFARFIQTFVEKGLPEDKLDPNGLNFEGMLGYRVTFAKELNKERQLAAGKKKLGKAAAGADEAAILKAGRRQDKKDKTKFYNHDRLIVAAVLGAPEEGGAKASKKAATKKTTAAKPVAAKGAKPTATAAPAASDDGDALTDQAEGMLLGMLADAKDNTVLRTSLSSLIVRKALADDLDTETRESLRKLIYSEEFLGRNAGWRYAAGEKGSPIRLA